MKEYKSKFENIFIRIRHNDLKCCKKYLKKLGFKCSYNFKVNTNNITYISIMNSEYYYINSVDELGMLLVSIKKSDGFKFYNFDEFKKEYEALYTKKYNKSFHYKIRSFFIRNFSLTYGIIKQIIELEKEQDDKTVKDIRERINNKLKDLVKQNEVMEEKEDLRIASPCIAGKTVEVPKKGYLFIDLEKAKEYYLKGGVHREIALNAGYEEAELNPVRNEWESMFVGKKIKGYFIDHDESSIIFFDSEENQFIDDYEIGSDFKNMFKTEKQAKSALAYAQLTQLMALQEYNGDWVPDWKNSTQLKHCIEMDSMNIVSVTFSTAYSKLSFKTAEIRNKFLENNLDLLKEYFELD